MIEIQKENGTMGTTRITITVREDYAESDLRRAIVSSLNKIPLDVVEINSIEYLPEPIEAEIK